MCKECAQATESLADIIRGAHADFRRYMAESRREIWTMADEYNSQSTGTSVNVTPFSRNLLELNAILAIFPGTTATLTIGERVLPLTNSAAGVPLVIPEIRMIVRYAAVRATLSGATSGTYYLELMGRYHADQYSN